MKTILVLFNLAFCAVGLAVETTVPPRIAFDGQTFEYLGSQQEGEASLHSYFPQGSTHGDLGPSLAVGFFPSIESVLDYARWFRDVRCTESFRSPKLTTQKLAIGTDESIHATVEKFFVPEDQSRISYTLARIVQLPGFSGVVAISFIEETEYQPERVKQDASARVERRLKSLDAITNQFAKRSAANNSTEHSVGLHGEYAEIDVEREKRAIKGLTSGDDDEMERWAERIESRPDRFAPAVLFHLANYHFEQGSEYEALFWMYSGRIRCRFDIERCTDKSVEGAVELLNQQLPDLLRLIQFEDIDYAKEVMQEAIEWDRETEHNYDARWIALHGIRAFQPASEAEEPLTVPEKTWKKLANKVRAETAQQYAEGLDELTEEQLEQIAAKIEELRNEQPSDDK